jgi:hypothetical protein
MKSPYDSTAVIMIAFLFLLFLVLFDSDSC